MDLLSLTMHQQPVASGRADGNSSDSREQSCGPGCNAADNGQQPSLELELKLSWPLDIADRARTVNSFDGKPTRRHASEDEATAKPNGPCTSSNDTRALRPYTAAAPSSSEMGGPCFSGGTSCSADEDDGRPGGCRQPRKKLRLTKEQSCFLEESFREHTTVTPKQKLLIAKRLNLQPRQVEVWFQNRRARTKLKQTEVDFEYLKRCCETLTEENRRLHRELQELRSLDPIVLASHLRGQTSQTTTATTLSLCPMCKRTAMAGIGMAKKLGSNFNKQIKQEEGAYHHHHPKLASQVG